MNGQQFKALRMRLGFKNRPQVAKVIGVAVDTVKKWERDERKVPGYAIHILGLSEAVTSMMTKKKRGS